MKDVRKSHKLTLEFERRLNIGSLCSIYLQIYRQRINETEGERKRAKKLQRKQQHDSIVKQFTIITMIVYLVCDKQFHEAIKQKFHKGFLLGVIGSIKLFC